MKKMEGLAQNENIFSKKEEEGRGDKWKDSVGKRNTNSPREKENAGGKNFFLLQNLYYAHSDINNKKLISS